MINKPSVQQMLNLENRGGGPLRKSNLLKLLSIIFAFALIAAACGSDDDDSGSSSDSSVLGEEEAPAEEEASASEPADKEEEGHSDDDGHDHSDDEDHSDEPAGTADDSLNGDGAELWESIVDGGAVAADDSLEPILVTLINIEGTPVGSFPEIREGMEAAVETVNNTDRNSVDIEEELEKKLSELLGNKAS